VRGKTDPDRQLVKLGPIQSASGADIVSDLSDLASENASLSSNSTSSFVVDSLYNLLYKQSATRNPRIIWEESRRRGCIFPIRYISPPSSPKFAPSKGYLKPYLIHGSLDQPTEMESQPISATASEFTVVTDGQTDRLTDRTTTELGL